MSAFFAYLKEFNFLSVLVRLILAIACGAVVGIGRSKKKQNAGLRTYVLTAIGAAMSMLLACYEYEMMTGQWAPFVEIVGMKFDASRYSAQVVSGIGFLAAGTILSSGHQQVTGLTTAAGLFCSACMGFACGAGMYDCVLLHCFTHGYSNGLRRWSKRSQTRKRMRSGLLQRLKRYRGRVPSAAAYCA